MSEPALPVLAEMLDPDQLMNQANGWKDKATASFKAQKYAEAQESYVKAVKALDAADGTAMLRSQAEAFITLKSLLHANIAQCLLNQELYRRAVDAATDSLTLNPENAKALYRRAQAYEKVANSIATIEAFDQKKRQEKSSKYGESIADLMSLKNVGGGGLSAEQLEQHLQRVQGKKDKVEAEFKEQDDEDESDDIGMTMVEMKKDFDRICRQYDLADAADEVADWLTSGEWEMTARRVATRFGMPIEDAYLFLKWINVGIQFQKENSEASAGANPLARQMMDSGGGVLTT